jgi:RNA-directed DNA polymerase
MRANKAEVHASAAHTGEGRRNLPGSGVGAEAGSVAVGQTKPETVRLMEAVVERSNMLCAYERVVANEGAPGVDGLTVAELKPWLKAHWAKVRQALLVGEYMPAAVRKVEIPKPQGGVRTLGIPTVMDRLIQQALHQVMQLLFEPEFSESSYGFRPGRNAQQAVETARSYVAEGKRWVVDLDLEKFLDMASYCPQIHEVLSNRFG